MVAIMTLVGRGLFVPVREAEVVLKGACSALGQRWIRGISTVVVIPPLSVIANKNLIKQHIAYWHNESFPSVLYHKDWVEAFLR